MLTNVDFFIISHSFHLRMRYVSDILLEKIRTHFMFDYAFRKPCRAWENMEKYCRARRTTDDNVIQLIHVILYDYVYKHAPRIAILVSFSQQQCCTNAPQSYFIRTLPVLLYTILWHRTVQPHELSFLLFFFLISESS